MKRLTITIILAFIVSVTIAQKVQYPGYTAYYNLSTNIPDSVTYIVTPHLKVAKRSAGFHATGTRPNLAKYYKHSGYDIGHNCDASDENGNKIDEYNSFDFANTFPQRPKLNRITWLALESYVRSLHVPVKVKVSYTGIKSYIGIVAVPLYCIKDIYYNGVHEKYIMPNNDTVTNHTFKYYKKI